MELDAKTFDLIGALAEVTFPEHEVTVYRNGAYGFARSTLENALRIAEVSGDEGQVKKIQKEIEAVRKEGESSSLKITLRGISQERRELLILSVDEEYPEKKNMLGQVEANPRRDLRIREELWKAYIVKVENAEGQVATLDTEGNAVRALLKLDESAVEAINKGISELQNGTRAGFELAAQDLDFLSKA